MSLIALFILLQTRVVYLPFITRVISAPQLVYVICSGDTSLCCIYLSCNSVQDMHITLFILNI